MPRRIYQQIKTVGTEDAHALRKIVFNRGLLTEGATDRESAAFRATSTDNTSEKLGDIPQAGILRDERECFFSERRIDY